MLALGRDARRSDDLRTESLEAAAPCLKALEPPLFTFLLARLDPDADPLRRLAASRTLGRVPLDTDQLLTLAAAVRRSGALVLPHLLPAFERSGAPKVGAALVAAVGKAPGRAAVTPAAFRKAIEHYPYAVRRRAGPLIHRLDRDAVRPGGRLAPSRFSRGSTTATPLGAGRSSSARAWRARPVTRSATRGGTSGPTSPGSGNGGHAPRDLLEAILFPSASFARGYEPVVVATDDGHVYTGVVVRETGDAIRLVTPDRSEVSLPRHKIEAIEPSRISVMPQGLDANLSKAELADLVAFLRSLQ